MYRIQSIKYSNSDYNAQNNMHRIQCIESNSKITIHIIKYIEFNA